MRSPSWLRRTEWLGSSDGARCWSGVRLRRKARGYGGKPTKRERALAIKRLMGKLGRCAIDIEAARATARIADVSTRRSTDAAARYRTPAGSVSPHSRCGGSSTPLCRAGDVPRYGEMLRSAISGPFNYCVPER